jgi:gluconate 2-dehydrogenase gamma chain
MASQLTRRAALKTIGAGAGAVAFAPWLSDEGLLAFARLQQTKAAPSLLVLTAPQFATLEAFVEAIIPADERSPGAKEARVADYVDLLLSESEDSVKLQWIGGLAEVDEAAQTRFSVPFTKLDPAQAEKLLAEMSVNELEPKTTVETFFTMAKQATIQGYYTSEIGIHKELGYKGNQLLAAFVGCQTEDGKDCPHCGQKHLTL